MSISFIIPAYNEESNIENTYKNLTKAIKNVKLKDLEIIFINDGSTDNSLKIIKKISKKIVKFLLLIIKKILACPCQYLKLLKTPKKNLYGGYHQMITLNIKKYLK